MLTCHLTEFKEIRKEWKAKKKEEEAQRKAEEEQRHRAGADGRAPHEGGADVPSYQVRQSVPMTAQAPGHPQLPPIGYQPANSGNSAAPQYNTQSPGMNEGMTQYDTLHEHWKPLSNTEQWHRLPPFTVRH